MEAQTLRSESRAMTELTDSALLSQIADHSQPAMLAIYRRYGGLVYSLALQTLAAPPWRKR